VEGAGGLRVTEQRVPDGKDVLVDREIEKAGKLEPLHARIRLVHHDEGDREEHFSFRILVHENPIAFQSRLNAAITASGIDRALDFRKLRILRFTPVPSGKKTGELVAKLMSHGGKIVSPTNDDLRAMRALAVLAREPQDPDFERWLRVRKPASALELFREVSSWLFVESMSGPPTPSAAPPASATSAPAASGSPAPPPSPRPVPPPSAAPAPVER